MANQISVDIYKASKGDPTTLTLEQALADTTNYDKWVESLAKEIKSLEDMGVWEEVPVSEAKGDIVPVNWVMKLKLKPDGTLDKFKARLVVRGDMIKGYDFETNAPVCAWSTVRMVMILALTWGWTTCTCDYSSAFCHSYLPEDNPVWIRIPRGYRSSMPGQTCLRLKKSLYGTTFAPRLWFDTLSEALIDYGLTQSTHDPCLFAKPGMMAAAWVDDLFLAFEDPAEKDRFLKAMEDKGFTLSMDDTIESFLGIKFESLPDGATKMTQPALIRKIIEATGMTECNRCATPAIPNQPLGKDPEGQDMTDTWSYPSVVGMLLYLSTNSRPDICYAVSQVARFTHSPKQSHAIAVKRIVRYLAGTIEEGTIVRPNGTLELNSMSHSDFAGLYNYEPIEDVSSAKSRMGSLWADALLFGRASLFPVCVWQLPRPSTTVCLTV